MMSGIETVIFYCDNEECLKPSRFIKGNTPMCYWCRGTDGSTEVTQTRAYARGLDIVAEFLRSYRK